jgi:hypothetical protein
MMYCTISGNQGETEGNLQDQLLLGTLRGIRQGFEYLQPCREVANRFRMR